MVDLTEKKAAADSEPNSQDKSLLNDLLQLEMIKKVDLRASEYILRGQNATYEEKLLVTFLFSAARIGHLCIVLEPKIEPSIEQVWPIEGEQTFQNCQSTLVAGWRSMVNWLKDQHPFLRRIKNRLYIFKNKQLESLIEAHFKRMQNQRPALEAGPIHKKPEWTDEQIAAIKGALHNSISFIVGGPGVGKTFTAHQLIETFINQFPKARVAIAAPTGKAVANLKQKFEGSLLIQQIEAQTLHKLFAQKILSYLPYDLLLIDESSMIDATFFLKLFQYAKPNSRLVFLGDPNQLPPIGTGTLFKDLIERGNRPNLLSVCQRTDLKDILNSASLIRQGRAQHYIKNYYDRFCKSLPKTRDLARLLSQKQPMITLPMSSSEKLKTFQKYKVLCAHKQGEFGSEVLNQQILKNLSHQLEHPILMTSNNYSLELFNGDLGYINTDNEGVFISRSPNQSYYDKYEKVRRIPLALLGSFEYAYCLSIHKSQGSEYESVSIVLPPKSEIFGRELLYTAVTRAKKEFEIFSDKHTLARVITNVSWKYSGLLVDKDLRE